MIVQVSLGSNPDGTSMARLALLFEYLQRLLNSGELGIKGDYSKPVKLSIWNKSYSAYRL
jgi:hypothetical protein